MAKVTNHNGDNHSTAEGFTKYRFSGSPTDQFEHRGEVGEIRRMSVTVECVAEGYDAINDGVRHQTKWKVTDATLGEPVERPTDPQLDFGDSDGEDYGDYKDTSTPDTDEAEDDGTVVAFSDRTSTAD
ncbi:DUF7171 family protein [Nocardia sp. R16R-3T]